MIRRKLEGFACLLEAMTADERLTMRDVQDLNRVASELITNAGRLENVETHWMEKK